MRRIILAVAFLLGALGFAGGANAACNNPNPNLSAPPFVDNCPLPAATLNRLFPINVNSTTALKSLGVPSTQLVFRAGYAVAGDGGSMYYTYSASPCTLGGGNGDNGSQVRASDGKCWVWQPVGITRPTPLVFGAVGNNIVDDTIAVQAAINASVLSGTPLFVDDGVHKYRITSSLVALGQAINLQGTGGNLGSANAPNPQCNSGLFAGMPTLTLLVLETQTFTLENVCFNMAVVPGTQAAGAAISIGELSGGYQAGWVIQGVSIMNPYDGIWLDSDTAQSQLGIQQGQIRDVTIREPSAHGIVFGRNTHGDGTGEVTLTDNTISCAVSGTIAVGIAYYDGDVKYDSENGPEGCNIGSEIIPSGGQNFNGDFRGTVGDSSGTHHTGGSTPHDFLIQPTAAGAVVAYVRCNGCWASGGTIPNGDLPVDIDNSAGADMTEITFNGLQARSGGTTTIMAVNGPVRNFTLTGSHINAWNNGTVTNGLALSFGNTGATEGHYVITGNQIGGAQDGSGSAMTNGIVITNANGVPMDTVMVGNDLSLTANPLVWTPSTAADDVFILEHNLGLDNAFPTIATAATIGPTLYPNLNMTGTTTVHQLWSGYANEKVTLISINGFTFAHGGTAGTLCGGSDLVLASGAVASFIWTGVTRGSCWAHIN